MRWPALLLLSVSCLLGCTGQAAPSASAPPAAGGSQASDVVTPKVNRVVLAVEPATRESLELRHMSAPNGWIFSPMYESLLGVDAETGKKIPRLATSWSIEPAGKAIRMQLRKGVKFHGDWGEFTSTDLLHQPQEFQKPDSSAGSSPFWQQVYDGIDIINDYEAVYKLKRADSNFFDYVSDQQGGMEVTSKKAFDKNGVATELTGPIPGTGAYQFVSHKLAESLVYKRVPYQHWRATPDFPEFEFRFMKEASTRLAALLANEVHLVSLPQDLLQQAITQGNKVAVGKVPALRVYINFLCCAFQDRTDLSKGWIDPQSPLADVRVRRALSKAVNRDELNKSLFGGKGTLLYNNPLGPQRIGWDPSWETRFQEEYGYDQVKARALLAEAGYDPNNPVKITALLSLTTGLSGAIEIGETVANYWRQIGVQVDLQNIDNTTQTAQTRAGLLNRHTNVMATNSNAWVVLYNQTAFGRVAANTGAGSPELAELDPLMATIANTMDEKKIEEAWRQIGEVLFQKHKYLPLFWLPVEVVYNPQYVSGWVLPGSITGNYTHIENIKAAR
jgi:ABC-type transport system substrate-binding protein